MGPAFVALLWLIVAGIYGLIWVGVLIVFIIARSRRWTFVKWISGGAAVVMACAASITVSLLGYGFYRLTVPRYVFSDTFGVDPDDSVRDIKSSTFWFADTGSTYLTFETDRATFDRLVPKDLPLLSLAEFQAKGWAESNPHLEWWNLELRSDSIIRFQDSRLGQGKGFSTESTLMVYDPKRKCAYFHFIGID